MCVGDKKAIKKAKSKKDQEKPNLNVRTRKKKTKMDRPRVDGIVPKYLEGNPF